MADQPKQFWMVKGVGPSAAVHINRESAETEARRLARENPGIPFFVMEAVAFYLKPDAERHSFDGFDESGSIAF